jgi:hypothetical protein
MPFDPDKFLKETEPVRDPAQTPEQMAQPGFDPDAFLAETAPAEPVKLEVVNAQREASLGPINRARYSIEPLQSNRMALLAKEYGEKNVQQDGDGNLYIKQRGEWRPVNKEGFSIADVADFAGALPEMAGGIVGTGVGAVGGAGLASIPTAIGLGAAGGAVGSAARQGLSAILGTPQVATPIERVAETGASAAMGGVFGGAGQGLKNSMPAIKKGLGEAGEYAAKVFKRAPKEVPGENRALQPGSEITHDIKVTPEFADEAANDYSQEYSRDMVKNHMDKLQGIAKRQNLPEPTYAQAAGGRAIQAEDKIINTPLVGGKVRKQVDAQLSGVKANLERNVGKFIDEDSTAPEVGLATKELSEGIVRATKRASQDLYQRVDDLGKDAMIGKKTFFNKYRDYAGELGLINPDLTRAKYAADSGLTKDEFTKLQSTLFEGMDAIKGTSSPKIRFASVNALRKTINSTAEEMASSNPNASRLLKKFGKDLDGAAEGVLNREHPKLGEIFKEANSKWAKYKNDQEFLDGFLPDGAENIVKKTMLNSDNVKRMKELVGESHVKNIGKSYVKDILHGLSKSGVARADSALTAIKGKRAQIVEALGEDVYHNVTENLYYLNRLNQPLNVSRPSLYSLIFNPGTPANFKGLAINIATSAKTLAESKGMGAKDVAKEAAKKASKPITVPFKRIYDAPASKQGAAGNVLTDEKQRNAAYFTRGPK